MAYTLTLRSSTNNKLSNTQMDNNFLYLQDLGNGAIALANQASSDVAAIRNTLNIQDTSLNNLQGTVNTHTNQINGLLSSVSTNTADITSIKNATTGLGSSLVPVGTIMWFSSSTPPNGWLPANGAAISRSAYSALFAVVGGTFGVGDGSTTFNLPDLRGQFIRGWDAGRGVDAGRVYGSWQSDAFKSHYHVVTGQPGLGCPAGGATIPVGYGGGFVENTSAVGDSETRPINVALLACIKY